MRGTRRNRRGKAALPTVHPRVCGEHKMQYIPVRKRHGSSPRMRGTLTISSAGTLGQRFIPAYAGNTSSRFLPSACIPVHPRVCGEHESGDYPLSAASGSSPRMRGTQCDCGGETLATRFIPAYAGNTPPRRKAEAPRPVHPRVCGEHEISGRPEETIDGSSPRMRGTRDSERDSPRHTRFIPAYAGNTESSSRIQGLSTVHPRVCGEHCPRHVTAYHPIGSSPRMRGTQHRIAGCHPELGFIPAYAGNTFPPPV